jgi:hypothetical protein
VRVVFPKTLGRTLYMKISHRTFPQRMMRLCWSWSDNIPLSNPANDLRGDVADRIYDIRCKIVHTKNDARGGEVELLLPYSADAQELSIDIELVQHIAQSVLIAGSTPLRGNV